MNGLTNKTSNYPNSAMPYSNLVLRMDKLKQGDVLLTDSGTKQALIIKKANWGNFSHAAIIISPVELLESNDNGIRHRELSRAGYLQLESARFECLRIPPPCRKAAILRHPDAFTAVEFRSAYLATLNAMWGRDYPRWSALIPAASSVPDLLKPFAAKVLSIFDWWELRRKNQQETFYGDFCSQLVFRFYEFLNRPLFAFRYPSVTIGPNELPQSRLQAVEDAVYNCDEYATEWRPNEPSLNSGDLNMKGTEDLGAEAMRYKLRMMSSREKLEQLFDYATAHAPEHGLKAIRLIRALDEVRAECLKLISVLLVEELLPGEQTQAYERAAAKLCAFERRLELCVNLSKGNRIDK